MLSPKVSRIIVFVFLGLVSAIRVILHCALVFFLFFWDSIYSPICARNGDEAAKLRLRVQVHFIVTLIVSLAALGSTWFALLDKEAARKRIVYYVALGLSAADAVLCVVPLFMVKEYTLYAQLPLAVFILVVNTVVAFMNLEDESASVESDKIDTQEV